MLRALNRNEESLASLLHSLELKPDLVDALYNLGNVRMNEKHEEAVTLYKRALAIKPDYVDAMCNLGGAYRQMLRLDEAVEVFHEALNLAPQNRDSALQPG